MKRKKGLYEYGIHLWVYLWLKSTLLVGWELENILSILVILFIIYLIVQLNFRK